MALVYPTAEYCALLCLNSDHVRADHEDNKWHSSGIPDSQCCVIHQRLGVKRHYSRNPPEIRCEEKLLKEYYVPHVPWLIVLCNTDLPEIRGEGALLKEYYVPHITWLPVLDSA
ncbi:hypothetical protein J6590_024047 [Homalodisca vitripennis]|nr:hypothetical protein J6590_024047 [Homalodisca vitripennis]